MWYTNETEVIPEEVLDLFWRELKEQAGELQSNEFEFYWEMLGGPLWMSWSIEINGKSLRFTTHYFSERYLEAFLNKGLIEIIKVYDQSENEGQYDKKRYRILKNKD